MEYLIWKLQVPEQLRHLKEKVIRQTLHDEGDSKELILTSSNINDNLKWVTIRKNLINGFTDRLPYDSLKYYTYETDQKVGINISRNDILA